MKCPLCLQEMVHSDDPDQPEWFCANCDVWPEEEEYEREPALTPSPL